MMIHVPTTGPFQQRGAVLVISLIVLVVITLLGITAMQTTTLDVKITGNNKNYRISFEAAEAALTEAQSRLGIPYDLISSELSRPRVGAGKLKIWDMKSDKPTDCTIDKSSTDKDPWWFRWDWNCWNNNAYKYSATLYGLETTSGRTARKPLYLIEYVGQDREPLNWQEVGGDQTIKDYYRITARGSTGQNSQSDVLLQSVFAWRYRDN